MSSENKALSIKASKQNVRISFCFIGFIVAAIAGICIRYLQTVKYIDSSTGFYTGGKGVQIILYALLTIAILFFCGVCFLSADSNKITIGETRNKWASVGSVLFAVSLLGDAYYCLSLGATKSGVIGSVYTGMMKSGALPLLIQSIAALFSAVYFFVLASDFSKGTAKAYSKKILATAPVIWAGARLIFRFLRQISFVQVSDLFLELVMIAFMIMFFMALAQTASGVYSNTFKWRIPAFGLSAALIAAVISVPRMIVALTAREFVNADHPFSLNDFIFIIFILTLLSKIKADADAKPVLSEHTESE